MAGSSSVKKIKQLAEIETLSVLSIDSSKALVEQFFGCKFISLHFPSFAIRKPPQNVPIPKGFVLVSARVRDEAYFSVTSWIEISGRS